MKRTPGPQTRTGRLVDRGGKRGAANGRPGTARRTKVLARSSGAQLGQGGPGDDACDVLVVIAIGQPPGEIVEVFEIAVFRPEERPHPIDEALLSPRSRDRRLPPVRKAWFVKKPGRRRRAHRNG